MAYGTGLEVSIGEQVAKSSTKTTTDEKSKTSSFGVNAPLPGDALIATSKAIFNLASVSRSYTSKTVNTLAKMMSQSSSKNLKASCQVKDKPQVMYQLTGTQKGDFIGLNGLSFGSTDYICVDPGLSPKCLPDKCLDKNCQVCGEPGSKFEAIDHEGKTYYHIQPPKKLEEL